MRDRFLVLRREFRFRRLRVKRWPYIPPHLGRALSRWGAEHFRTYPWREDAEPFQLLVAEMLLRRTTAQQVARIYPIIVNDYGSASAIARADLSALIEILRPLGLASQRARALREMATYLMEHFCGRIPASPVDLAKVPHVGPYTANAVACFGFGIPVPIVDVNVIRVLTRFTGRYVGGSNPHRKEAIWRSARLSLPTSSVRGYQYALLDLAAQVCKKKPACGRCPLRRGCHFRQQARE